MAETKVANLGLLLRCYEGLRNWRALAMLVAGFVLAALLGALDATIAAHMAYTSPTMAMLLGGLLMLIAALVVLAGINGAGLLLVDQADGNPPRGFAAAFFGGLGVTLQAIVCLILLGLGLLLVVLVLWALSFLGKIPGIGPLFAFLLAGPTMLVLAFCYALLVFGVALMFVALWRGNGMLGSIGRAIDIVTKRPLDVVLHFIVLALLIVPIEVFVAAVLFAGSALTGLMYASGGMGGGGVMDMAGGFMSMASGYGGGGGATMAATFISIGVVLAAVWALFVLIGTLGNILIFDSLAAETSATSAGFLGDKVKQLKQKVEEHRPQAPVAARPAPPPAPNPAAARAAACGHCGAALTPGDRFCGECGSPSG